MIENDSKIKRERGGKKCKISIQRTKGKVIEIREHIWGKQSHEREKIILIISQVKCAEQRVDINAL